MRGQLFGPFYGGSLQPVVNHMVRLSSLVASDEERLPAHAQSWVVGRADEIAEFLRDVLARWRSGAIDEAHAFAALTEYIDDLHAGYREHLEAIPSCCRRVPPPTTIAPLTDNVTRALPLAEVVRPVPRATDTAEVPSWPSE
jgi:hypothetical protein